MDYLETLKRSLPIKVVEALEFEINPNFEKIIPTKEGDGFLVRFEEPYDYSDFFFEVTSSVRNRNSDGFNCKWKPRNATIVDEHKGWLKVDGLVAAINNWCNLVARYHNTKNTPFDDPMLKHHKEWFSNQIHLVDYNLEEPFAVNQIVLILEHYGKLQDELRKLEGVPKEEVHELVQEIEKEKHALGSTPKRKSFDSMLNIWARVAKNYPTVLKFIIDTFNGWGLNKIFDSVLKSIGEG